MKTALRTLAAILAGSLAAFALIIAVELFGNAVHPFPKDLEGTHEEMCRHVERIPTWLLAVVVPAWGATAFLGTWIARRVGNPGSFAVVGLVLLAALVLNISMLPYPIWFKVANLVVLPAAMVLAYRMSTRRKPAVVGEASLE